MLRRRRIGLRCRLSLIVHGCRGLSPNAPEARSGQPIWRLTTAPTKRAVDEWASPRPSVLGLRRGKRECRIGTPVGDGSGGDGSPPPQRSGGRPPRRRGLARCVGHGELRQRGATLQVVVIPDPGCRELGKLRIIRRAVCQPDLGMTKDDAIAAIKALRA